MGRPLFSKKYAGAPAEPERTVDPFCQKWSTTNNFNPDSDEFFANAQEERVLLPEEVLHIPADGVEFILSDTSSLNDSGSNESGGSEAGSPVGNTIQTMDAQAPVQQWSQDLLRSGAAASDWLIGVPVTMTSASAASSQVAVNSFTGGIQDATTTVPYRSNLAEPGFHTPALIPATAPLQARPTENVSNQTPTPPLSPPQEPLAFHAADTVENAHHRPSPEDISSVQAVLPFNPPMTPHRNNVRGVTQTIYTPSPPPSVTPRFYSWQSHAIPAIPTSPTRLRGARDSPLTNPHARRSYIRIGTSQAPVLVTNTAN